MDKKKVARVLEEMATLLTLLGANAFKSRAFQNGARTIETLEEDLDTVVEEGRLGELRGVGKGIAAVVDELVRTGRCADHDALRDDVPAGVLELL
ncbi:MAG: histidinol-phosphatase, partial [Gemmatimonadetes bacterium]|nr:histidinol-phosphatase [Gemmatimonadota bacterium]